MKQFKFKFDWTLLFAFVLFLWGVFFLCKAFIPFSDPAGYNYRLDYLTDGEAVDAYLYTSENIVSLVMGTLFATYALFVLIVLSVSYFRNSKGTHILLVELGLLLITAFAVVRAVWCIQDGSTSIFPGVLYILAALSLMACMVLFLKKTWDGDSLTSYTVAVICALVFLYFGSGSSDSYSVLSLFLHGNDVTFVNGYLTSRGYMLMFGLLTIINSQRDYFPAKVSVNQ